MAKISSCSDIIVIGASSGGFQVLKQIISEFPVDLAAAVFVVLHIEPERTSKLAEIFAQNAKIKVVQATDKALIERSCVYIAAPDYHLTLEPNRVRLNNGPRHNFSRPAIDPLFASAADFAASQRAEAAAISSGSDRPTWNGQ